LLLRIVVLLTVIGCSWLIYNSVAWSSFAPTPWLLRQAAHGSPSATYHLMQRYQSGSLTVGERKDLFKAGLVASISVGGSVISQKKCKVDVDIDCRRILQLWMGFQPNIFLRRIRAHIDDALILDTPNVLRLNHGQQLRQAILLDLPDKAWRLLRLEITVSLIPGETIPGSEYSTASICTWDLTWMLTERDVRAATLDAPASRLECAVGQ